MKLLRPLAGYTLYDHKTNDSIRRELRITGILDKTDEYRRNWLSQLQRMPQNRIPLKSHHFRPQGRRTIGRPKKRWREQLQLWRRNGSKGPRLDVYDDDDSARTAQQTVSVSSIKTSHLVLYKEIISVCSEVHTKHINTPCGQNVEFYFVKPGGM